MKQLDLAGEVYVAPPRGYRGTLPLPSTIYLVASWYGPHQRWKIWPEEWLMREAAEEMADRIGEVRGHTHYTILEIKLPGAAAAP